MAYSIGSPHNIKLWVAALVDNSVTSSMTAPISSLRYGPGTRKRTLGKGRSVVNAVRAVGMIVAVAGPAAAATLSRVDLKVLVVTDGTPWVEAIRQELVTEGVAATVVNLADSGRPVITADFLSDAVGGTPHAKFNGV